MNKKTLFTSLFIILLLSVFPLLQAVDVSENIGYEGVGGGGSYGFSDTVGNYVTTTTGGHLKYIKTYIDGNGNNAKCAVYNYSSDGNASTLVAYMEEKTVANDFHYEQFNITSSYDIVYPGTKYFLVVSTDGGASLKYLLGHTGEGIQSTTAYTDLYESPLLNETVKDYMFTIYAHYENWLPNITSPSVEPSTGIESDTTFYFNATFADGENDTMQTRCVITRGAWEDNSSMTYVSGDNQTGASFTYSRTIPTSGTYSYKFIAYDGISWNETSTETFNVGVNTSFQLDFPVYLNVGDYLWSIGTIKRSDGEPLNYTWVTTKVVDSSDMTTVVNSEMEYYVVNGNYQYIFSTSTMTPGMYYILVNYTYDSNDFSTNWTLYLSNSTGPGHYSTTVYFNFYDENKGTGLISELFKIYVSSDTTIDSNDRIYRNTHKTYTGDTFYYRIDDYFDNKIYPTGSSYQTFTVAEINEGIDIPIIWYDLSVKNLNQSIIYFTMENGSRYYNMTLFPMDSVHINVLPGKYNITMYVYSSINGTLNDTVNDNITITGDSFFIATGYNAMVHISWYNTNEALGLPDETLKLYIDGHRQTSQTHWTYINNTINVTIKDYYNLTLYTGNHTLNATYTFLDFGLTFHSYKFSNLNNEYYMISFLRSGGSRWFERGICPYEPVEFLLPSGSYQLRIYDADNNNIYTNNSISMVNSKVYVINGSHLQVVINGQSAIVGQLLELNSELDYALMPDDVFWSSNPPIRFSIFDRTGQMLGNNVWKVCPALDVISTTRNSSYSNITESHPLIPTNGTTENGTIIVIKDVVYLSGNSSVNWVNITYTNNKTLMQNTTYVPSKLNLNGENITIVASDNISVLRETTFSKMTKFYWDIYNSTDNPGHIGNRAGYHSTVLYVENTLSVPIYDVYVFAGFSDKTTPDLNSIQIEDLENGVLMERGEDFKTAGDGVEFMITGGLNAGASRSFEAGYYKDTAHQYFYEDAQIELRRYTNEEVIGDEFYNYAEFVWINTNKLAFRGSLRVKFNFNIEVDKDSVKVYDRDTGKMIDDEYLIIDDDFIWINNNNVGTVESGGCRNYGVYFQELLYPGTNLMEFHLSTPIFIFGGIPFTPFLVIFLLMFIPIIIGFALMIRKWRYKSSYMVLVMFGIVIDFVFFILQAKGV